MTNPYFSQTGYPATRQTGPTSAPLRAEFALIAAAFDKLPTLSGNANKLTKINTGANALTTTGLYEVGGKLGVNNATPSGWLDIKPSGVGDIALKANGAAGGSANVLVQGDNGSASAFWISAGADNKLRIGGTGGISSIGGGADIFLRSIALQPHPNHIHRLNTALIHRDTLRLHGLDCLLRAPCREVDQKWQGGDHRPDRAVTSAQLVTALDHLAAEFHAAQHHCAAGEIIEAVQRIDAGVHAIGAQLKFALSGETLADNDFTIIAILEPRLAVCGDADIMPGENGFSGHVDFLSDQLCGSSAISNATPTSRAQLSAAGLPNSRSICSMTPRISTASVDPSISSSPPKARSIAASARDSKRAIREKCE